MAITKANAVVANSVSMTAGAASTTSTDQDITGSYRTLARIRFTNGATGPTVQAQCQVMVSEDAVAADYMTLTTVYGGTTNSAVTEFAVDVPDAAEHLQFIYGSNTVQAVTIRVVLEKITAI